MWWISADLPLLAAHVGRCRWSLLWFQLQRPAAEMKEQNQCVASRGLRRVMNLGQWRIGRLTGPRQIWYTRGNIEVVLEHS